MICLFTEAYILMMTVQPIICKNGNMLKSCSLTHRLGLAIWQFWQKEIAGAKKLTCRPQLI